MTIKDPDEYWLPPDTCKIPYDWGMAPGRNMVKMNGLGGPATKLLVTGVAFIGSNFIYQITEFHPDWEVINLDILK